MSMHRLMRLGTQFVATLIFLLSAVGAVAAPRIGPSLQDALNLAGPAKRLEVVVSFVGDGPLTAGKLAFAAQPRTEGHLLPLRCRSPGVIATPGQVSRAGRDPACVRCGSTSRSSTRTMAAPSITGVDRLRPDARLRAYTGLPFSGKGVSVLVNDSGIDGTHADLQYRHARGAERARRRPTCPRGTRCCPITYVEGLPNTDIGSGHGTHCRRHHRRHRRAVGRPVRGRRPGRGPGRLRLRRGARSSSTRSAASTTR